MGDSMVNVLTSWTLNLALHKAFIPTPVNYALAGKHQASRLLHSPSVDRVELHFCSSFLLLFCKCTFISITCIIIKIIIIITRLLTSIIPFNV